MAWLTDPNTENEFTFNFPMVILQKVTVSTTEFTMIWAWSLCYSQQDDSFAINSCTKTMLSKIITNIYSILGWVCLSPLSLISVVTFFTFVDMSLFI